MIRLLPRCCGTAVPKRECHRLHRHRFAANTSGADYTCELMERRTLLSTYTVTSTSDGAQTITQTGPGAFNASTLRAAVIAVNSSAGADTISFQAGLRGIISLTTTLQISDTSGATTITGPGPATIGITGIQPLLLISNSVTAIVSGLQLAGATANANAPQGGAIQNSGSISLSNCTFTNNYASGNGGAIDNQGSAVVNGCVFSGNTAMGLGGAIYNAGTLSVSMTTFASNIANLGGGVFNDAAINTTASAVLTGCTLSGNSGGGLSDTGAVSLINCTIANNVGGGVNILARNATITNSTITANTGNATPTAQAGLSVAAGAAAVLNNSVVAGNMVGGTTPADISGTVVPTSKRNLIGTGGSGGLTNGGGSGNQVNNANPGLGVLGNYGGAVQTVPLLSGSPAIDTGSNALAVDATSTPLATDARGLPRQSDGTVDKGAYEVQSVVTVNTTQDETTPDSTISLCEAAALANADLGPETVTINFDASVFATSSSHTIALLLGPIEFTARPNASTTIQGPGTNVLSISGQNISRVFWIDSNASLTISAATITGGFSSGDGGAIVDNGTLSINASVLSGNAVVNADGGAIYDAGALALSGCTLTSNSASSLTSGQGSGGAICAVGTLSITNSTFLQNSATTTSGTSGVGGAIDAIGSFSVTGGSFSQNTASNSGGAFDSSATQASFNEVSFDHNSISGANHAGIGGAVHIATGTVAVIGCTFTSNSAYTAGAIANSGQLSLITSTLTANSADANSGSGGAITNYNRLTVAQSTISNNTAGGYGAGLENLFAANVSICTFSGNVAQTMGGGIYTAGTFSLSGSTLIANEAVQYGGAGISNTGSSVIVDSTLAMNVSDNYDGGGVMVFSGSLRLTNDTLSLNRATNGAGVVVYSPATLSVYNTIIAGNTLLDGATENDVLGNIAGQYDLLGTAGSSGLINGVDGNIVGLNPNLAPLGFYGGTTQTMPPIAGSAAIDNGSIPLAIDVVGSPIQVDQIGQARFYGNVDIGSVEFQPAVLTITANTAGLVLERDPDGVHLDWTIAPDSGRIYLPLGQSVVIQGSGFNDSVSLNYTNGNPIPPSLQFNGLFTISGLQGTNPLAGTSIDIARSTLYFLYPSTATDPAGVIRACITNAYNGGAWNGVSTSSTGVIGSSAAAGNGAQTTAVGYADGADGLISGLSANAVEVQYTLYGDANLTGTVDFGSFTRLTQHYNLTGQSWDTGDFNYDGSVDIRDFTLMTRTYGTQLGSQVTQAPVSRVSPTQTPLLPVTAPPSFPPESSSNLTGDVAPKQERNLIGSVRPPKIKPPKPVQVVQRHY